MFLGAIREKKKDKLILKITGKDGEEITVDLCISRISGRRVWIGIDAPKNSVRIIRETEPKDPNSNEPDELDDDKLDEALNGNR